MADCQCVAQRIVEVGHANARTILARIVVNDASLTLHVRSDALNAAEGQPISIDVPVKLQRSGLALRLIVRGRDEAQARGPNPRLIALLAKAQRWFTLLRTGQYPSVSALAQEVGIASKDVTQTVYLAFLAPDLAQRIVEGTQPMGLGVGRLLSMAPLPTSWDEQRRV